MSKVLLIDDDPHFCQILDFEFKKNGLAIEFVHTKSQAQQLLLSNKYDLVLLDIFLPNKDDGLSILKNLSINFTVESAPVVLITSMSTQFFQQEANVDQYLEMAQSFISKTETPSEILKKVQQILAEKNQTSN
jgi:CheY-like chemotaxis protein